MNARDNVQRIDSDPHAYSRQFDNGPDMYEHHINDACRAIQQTPFRLVDAAFIDSVLRVLGCKAMEAHLPELSEAIESFADEVQA